MSVRGLGRDSPEINLKPIVISSAILALIVCSLSEFGMVPYQSYDYLIHNYKLNILATKPLPIYEEDKGIYMCYYLGFYLIPALLSKCTSLSWAKYYFFLWCAAGVTLTFIWTQIKFIHFGFWQRIFVCLSLLIGAYISICYPLLDWLAPQSGVIQNNAVYLPDKFVLNQVPVFTRSLSESPQHTIPCILMVSMFVAVCKEKNYLFSLLFLLPATLFLTPFATVGMLPFVLIPVFVYFKDLIAESFGRCLLFLITTTLAYLPVLLFLAGSQATDMESNRVIWNSGASDWIVYYAFYLFFSYGIWFVFFGRDLLYFDRTIVLAAIAFACVLSLFQVGYYNDLNIRAALCIQMIMGMSIAHLFVNLWSKKQKLRKGILLGIVFWVANGTSSVKFYYDRIFVLKGKRNTIENPNVSGFGTDIYDMLERAYSSNGPEVVKQYSLKEGSLFEKYLLKK
ncbi:hypothetical protein [Dyadobacter soli]|nr:hypothetical protein [Dyadobacter soli]